MTSLTIPIKSALSDVYERLGQQLDISEARYNEIVKSYNAVGDWLSSPDSVLAPYKPEILPQGSFMLGTMIPSSNENDDIDIDLVCRLSGKQVSWTQRDLKQVVGRRLKQHKTYSAMLDKEGTRCWTLNYADSSNFHMDILPALVDNKFQAVFERAMADIGQNSVNDVAIRITDRDRANYATSVLLTEWPKSNPFGYGIWFFDKARITAPSAYSLRKAVAPVPAYQAYKYPLQRVVQILKWHRDQVFKGDEDKPISIIITTLAARAYQKETDLTDALNGVVLRLESFIEKRYNPLTGRTETWIVNPVNAEENFADKWSMPGYEQREVKFYAWVKRLRADLEKIQSQAGNGYHRLKEAMEKPFGNRMVTNVFSNLGEHMTSLRDTGKLRMAEGTGTLGLVGRGSVPTHTNYGAAE